MKLECQAEPHGIVLEWELPPSVREALEAARRSRPQTELTCVAFHTLSGGHETAHVEPEAELGNPASVSAVLRRLRAKDVLVLSVTVTETTFETVDIVTHVLVAHTSPLRSRS
jgi:hypothetical protein